MHALEIEKEPPRRQGSAMSETDKYTHDSFTVLKTTELIREAVDHVLRQSDSDSQELQKDLASWKDDEERKRRSRDNDESVEDIDSNIPFELVKRVHKQLAKTPLGID